MLVEKTINILIIKGFFFHGFMTVLLFDIVFGTSKGDAWYFFGLVVKVQIHLLLEKINQTFVKG